MNIKNSMFNGIDLSKATITWPELDEVHFIVGDIVIDKIDHPRQQGTVMEVVGEFHYKVKWPGEDDLQVYDELESVFLDKYDAKVKTTTDI